MVLVTGKIEFGVSLTNNTLPLIYYQFISKGLKGLTDFGQLLLEFKSSMCITTSLSKFWRVWLIFILTFFVPSEGILHVSNINNSLSELLDRTLSSTTRIVWLDLGVMATKAYSSLLIFPEPDAVKRYTKDKPITSAEGVYSQRIQIPIKWTLVKVEKVLRDETLDK